VGTKGEVLDDDFTVKTPFDNYLFVEAEDIVTGLVVAAAITFGPGGAIERATAGNTENEKWS
jgi:hypothetical protein